jgi:ubiquinone/menaquinone biosynthesis C-methylase UbiE
VTPTLPPLVSEAIDRVVARRLQEYLDACRRDATVGDAKRLSLELLAPRPGERLLDLGCGTGDDVLALAGHTGPAGLACGVDENRWLIREAVRRRAERGSGAEFIAARGEALPFPAGAFDGCRAERVLVHAADPAPLVAELARVTRAGGRLVLAEPDWTTLRIDGGAPSLTRRMVAWLAARFARPEVGRLLERLLQQVGCRDVEVRRQTARFTDLPTAALLLTLTPGLAAGVQHGQLAAADADAWWAQLQEADAAGRFAASLAGYIAVGRFAPSGRATPAATAAG